VDAIESFYPLAPAERKEALEAAILKAHTYHFERNTAYRRTLVGRGVGLQLSPVDFTSGRIVRLLRPSALTFKSYVESLGYFPQDNSALFLAWLNDQLSIPLPPERQSQLRRHYPTLEALLQAVESLYADLGIEIVTSTGTSGVTSFVARDGPTVDLAVNSFFTHIRHCWGIQRGMAMVFMMPSQTRVAMARVARIGTQNLDWAGSDTPVYYTMPFSAAPDLIRIRTGRVYSPGFQGIVERHILNPVMGWANGHLAMPRTLHTTRQRLQSLVRAGCPLMLLGGLVQLHTLIQPATDEVHSVETHPSLFKMSLPAGSRITTGGGMKENYPINPDQIRSDLQSAFAGTPVSDVYGMAEANWAAFECPQGNYHIAPWVYVAAVDDDDRIIQEADATGLLAFFDPLGGGSVIPPFFQTADRVRLINGSPAYDPSRLCPCGMDTPYVLGRIQRVDLVEEAGCAAQV
jgi:hypothetical protein